MPIVALIDALGALVIEFGPAEFLDSLFVRPIITFWALQWSGDRIIGIMLGKLLADIAFYIVAGLAHRLQTLIKLSVRL